MQGSTPVSGTVNYNGSGVTFTPAATLTPNTVYTATITAGAKDLSGKALANPYVWSWTTGSAPDVTPPMVTSTINANGATNVSINTKVGAFFTEAIDPLTITSTTFTLMQGTTPVAGTVNGVAFAVTFTPATSLTPNTVYTATLTTGVKDLAGNALASPYTWSWTTAAVPDTTSPTVSSTIPVNNDTSMSINSALAAVFSEAMDPSTVNSATFILMQGATLVPGTVTYLGVTAAFVPTTALAYNTMYTATISTGAKDLAGNPLAANYQWSFTTNNNGGGGGVTLSSDKAITSFSFVLPAVTGIINETAKTIAVTVPVGTNLTALVATFTTTGTGVKVGTMSQTSIATPNNFTSPVAYVVTAADASTATYTVTVTIASSSAKAITAYSFAGYTGAVGTINETAKTIAVTVPFGTPLTALVATFTTTGAVVNVGTTVQTSLSTPNNFTSPVAYIVTAGDASTATYTVTVTIASNSAKAITSYSFAGYTGAAGTINETAKTIAVTVPFGTPLTALVATFATTGTVVKVGTTVQTSAATPNNFTTPVAYIVTAGDASTATYSVTVTIAPNSAKTITAYSFAGYTGAGGTINETAKTIAVTVPFGTPLTALVATFTTTGTGVKVGTTVQTSAATPNDFTSPVVYTVTAGDASTVNYTVTVTVAQNTAKAITAYSFALYAGATGTINETAKTIAVIVPYGTPLTALVATFTTTGTGVKVGTTVQTSTATPNDFTSPVVYTVTAGDASTVNYTVTVTVSQSIVLGLAGTFAILATSAISGSGNHITGDVGLNPGSAQGIAPSEITGNIHVDDTAVINAQASLLAAFNDAVSRSTNAQSLPGNLGGLTKAPGLYVNGSSSGISGTGANAILTLDAGGDPNAVFIFKMSSTFVMDPGTSIVLSGSAKAQNVYFWVGSSATLDTTTIFKGIILAAVTITVNNGANIVGSLFAGAAGGTGAVTVQGSTIAIPTP
jgi:ribosomal protein L21E